LLHGPSEPQLPPSLTPPFARIEADVVLVDIEGTISPISFVRDVLFPYSRDRIREFIAANPGSLAVKDILAQTETLAGTGDPLAALVEWQAKDIKAPPLKKLQGLIWESGYRSGAFRSPIFPDALRALKQWRRDGLRLYVYSSGSVQAQLLLFEFSADGDLRPLFSGHFDTDIGPKVEPRSYHLIGERIGVTPERMVFFSDSTMELHASRAAGCQTVHVVKDETRSDRDFVAISDFCEITLARLGTP
jgi:enolase-phosphatase E1